MMMRRRGPGLVRTAARTAVIAGTATAVSGSVYHRQQERYAREDAQQQAGYEQQAAQYAPPPAAPPPDDPPYMAELERLSAMKQRGVISDDEFQAKKKQLLGI
jgi:putative oligomerization/nucleic acid binding protein